jgi:Fe-S-cluster containining protein
MCHTGIASGASPALGSAVSFDPDARCCTYQPEIWSFLAGAALADTSPGGRMARDSIRARMTAGENVTPLGLGRTRRFDVLYGASVDGFGRAHALRCPHYVVEGSLCAIWKHRESTCSTWFCKHDHGAVSKRFWDRLHELLSSAEHALARHVVLELDLGDAALQALFPVQTARSPGLTAAELDGLAEPARQRAVWGRWHGKAEEFYVNAARIVSRLSWTEIRALGGADLALRESLLLEARSSLSARTVPDRVRANTVSVVVGAPHADGNVVIGTYSGFDPLEVPEVLLRCLPYFDGRPTRDAIAAIEDALEVRVERSLVRRLVEFGVLEDVG